jgi:hypothetical protein
VRVVACVIGVWLLRAITVGQAPTRPPVIDVHVHSTNTSPQQALDQMKSLNIRFLVLSSLTADVPQWASALDSTQFLPGLVFPCAAGRAPITGRPCFDAATEFPDVTWLIAERCGDRHEEIARQHGAGVIGHKCAPHLRPRAAPRRGTEAYSASRSEATPESQASTGVPTQSAPRPRFDSPPRFQRSAAAGRPAIAVAHAALTSSARTTGNPFDAIG